MQYIQVSNLAWMFFYSDVRVSLRVREFSFSVPMQSQIYIAM